VLKWLKHGCGSETKPEETRSSTARNQARSKQAMNRIKLEEFRKNISRPGMCEPEEQSRPAGFYNQIPIKLR